MQDTAAPLQHAAVFFPHFYLSNEIFLRHQYLYAPSLLRALPSDRPPQDSKPVKKTLADLKSLGFVDTLIPTEKSAWVYERYRAVLQRAYADERELYIRHMGKYGKERTASKTFHLCRVKVWPEVVTLLLEMDFATLDSIAGGSKVDFQRLDEIRALLAQGGEIPAEWCFSTRQMVIAFLTCLTLDYQRSHNLPRATDDPLFDELACMIECLPQGSSEDLEAQRAVLEFAYPVPRSILEAPLETLSAWRTETQDLAEELILQVRDAAESLSVIASMSEIAAILRILNGKLKNLYPEIRGVWEKQGIETEIHYAQYRWYLPLNSVLRAGTLPKPATSGDVGLGVLIQPISPTEEDAVRAYPGCFIWTRETASLGQNSGMKGLLKKWLG